MNSIKRLAQRCCSNPTTSTPLFSRLLPIQSLKRSIHQTGVPQAASNMGGLNLGRLEPAHTALFICDVQERFRSVIHGFPAVVDVSRRMSMASRDLGLSGIIVTEQYPKALGSTVTEVSTLLSEMPEDYVTIVPKTDFSMLVPDVKNALLGDAMKQTKDILLVGLETHVCVFQTTMDLLDMGYRVHILVDGVSSQRIGDRSAALHRLSRMHENVFIASSEMCLFEMMKNTSHPKFKAVSAIVKEPRDYDPLEPM